MDDDMTHEEFEQQYWGYYLLLEDKFITATRYVHLSPDNFKCYSLEYVNLLLTAGSEIENIIKLLTNLNTKDNMPTLLKELKKRFERYHSFMVKVVSLSRSEFSPLKMLQAENPGVPEWWRYYNVVKHNRCANFKLANMGNVLEALACLFSLCCIGLKDFTPGTPDCPSNPSRLFDYRNFQFRCINFSGAFGVLHPTVHFSIHS